MNIYKGIGNFVHNPNNFLTVGTFDGVHKGHRFILDHLIALSHKISGTPALVTFDPHPQEVLNNRHNEPIQLLTTLDEKLYLLEQIGIENVYVVEFSEEFAQTPSEIFVNDYLLAKIGLKGMIVGYDHGFGKDRAGSMETIKEIFARQGLRVEQLPEFSFKDEKVSSSTIRASLKNTALDSANQMLGYSYFITGTVVEGRKRGRTLGFPTANIRIDGNSKLIPALGVYAATFEVDNELHTCMVNIGNRPTFSGQDLSIEANIFNFDKLIYGKKVRISFLSWIREEKKFQDKFELISQLQIDKKNIQEYLIDFAKPGKI